MITLKSDKKFDSSKITAKVETITPKVAEEFLNHNPHNRSLRQKHIDFLSREMATGNWKVAEPIIIDWNGNLVDGQHRLWAVINADVTVDMLVVRGVDPEVFSVIDQGLLRSIGDLHHQIGGRNSNAVTSVASAMIRGITVPDSSKNRWTRIEIARFAKEHEDLIHEILSASHKVVGMNATHRAAFCNASYDYGKDKILEMLRRLKDNVFTGPDDAMNRFSRFLAENNVRREGGKRSLITSHYHYSITVSAIRSALRNKSVQLLRPSNQDFQVVSKWKRPSHD